MNDVHPYMVERYQLNLNLRCSRCSEPGVIVWRGKTGKLCPACFLWAMESLLAEFDPAVPTVLGSAGGEKE